MLPPKEAVRLTWVGVVTVPAVAGNVVEVEPVGTVTVDGTIAPAGAEFKETVAPLPVAADAKLMVHVEPVDGLIDVGLQDNPLTPAG